MQPTLVSLNRFEKKKNAALAVRALAKLRARARPEVLELRLVIAGIAYFLGLFTTLKSFFCPRWL